MISRRLVVALIAGITFGVAATYFVIAPRSGARFSEVVAPDLQDVADVTTAEAEVLRKGRYESLSSIEEILALPTDFAETEALYAVAGRSNSAEVQDLMYQAAKIRDRDDRRAALAILFLRLTEMDPQSALAISRAPAFASDRELEASVWRAWGRLDLIGALRVAEELRGASRHTAAQALYQSLRGLDSDDASIISTMLGVQPDRNTRMKQLLVAADRSPADAIAYIQSTAAPHEKHEYYSWLAQYLAKSDQGSLADYSRLIESNWEKRIFEQAFAMQQAASNPEEVLQQALSSTMTHDSQMRIHTALRQLATTDPQRALDFLQQMPNSAQQKQYEAAVMMTIARSDPELALEWVRQGGEIADIGAVMSVLTTIAQTDPQLALAETQSISDPRRRNQMIASIASSMAQVDPQAAAEMIAQITDPRNRTNIIGQVAAQWALSDIDSALNWIASLDASEQQRAYQSVGQNLVHNDPDKAAELLARMPVGSTGGLEMQIAQAMARTQGVTNALAFAEQFKGRPEYSNIQLVIVNAAADTDTEAAMRLAARMNDVENRDRAYATIIGREANSDPQQALRWLSSINSEQQRAAASAQIARSWFNQDAPAATTWIDGLPQGDARDDAIVAIATSYNSNYDPAISLIESIRDPRKQQQALLARVQMMMRYDPAGASALLQDMDLSDEERRNYEEMLNRMPLRY